MRLLTRNYSKTERAAQPVSGATKQELVRLSRWRLIVNTLIVMAGVLLSRLLGFVRDAAILSRFGAEGAAIDSYVAAFRIPDFLYLVVIGGALATTLIPVFQEVWTEQGEERAWQLASAVLNLAVLSLVLVLPLVAWAAPPIIRWLYPTQTPAEQQLIVDLTRVFLLSPLLLGLGGVAMALLNARGNFSLPAAAPNVYNLTIIFGAIVLAPALGIWGVAWGVILGAALYLLVQLPGLARVGMRYSPSLGRGNPAVRRVGRQILPRLVGQSAVQINIIATTSFAALLPDDPIAPLNYAYQLMLLPHGIFVMSLVTVLFPRMAELYAAGERIAFRDTALRAVRMVVFVTLPLAVSLAILRVPVIRLLYERGAFEATSTALIAAPLLIYLTSSVAFAASEPLVRAFYAMQDTRTPVYVALATIALNITLAYASVRWTTWGAAGLALAFSVANNAEALVLLVLLRRRLGADDSRLLLRSFAASAVSAAAMGAALLLLISQSRQILPMITLAGPYGAGADAFRLLAWLALAGLAALVTYFAAAALLRAPELREALALLRNRRQS